VKWTETSCENGFVYKSTCYKIHIERVNWFTAVNRCLSYNASFAVFDDHIHSYFSFLPNEPLWIGLIKSWWTWPDAGLSVAITPYSTIQCTNFFVYRGLIHKKWTETSCENAQRRLRSASSHKLIVRRSRLTTAGDRAFGVAASPRLWNSLPTEVISASSSALFRKRLKTHLFQQSFA